MKVRGPSIYGGYSVYEGRRKLHGGFPSPSDAQDWIDDHNADGSRKEPLPRLRLRDFDAEFKQLDEERKKQNEQR